MPLQGQWERQQAPLFSGSRRERRTLAVVAGLLALGVAAVLYFTLLGSSGARAGCVDVTVPSTMGAGTMHACGDAARHLCRSQNGRSESDPFARAAHANCRKAGYSAPS
jgi:hypothetical protein